MTRVYHGYTTTRANADLDVLPQHVPADRSSGSLRQYNENNKVFNPLDFGASGDGSRDDTAEVVRTLLKARQWADTTSPSAKPIVDLMGRPYRVSEGLYIPGGRGMAIRNGDIVPTAGIPASHYLLTGGDSGDANLDDGFKLNDLVLENLTLDSQHRCGGFLCQRYNRVTVDGCRFFGYTTDGLKTAVDGHELVVTNATRFAEYVWGDTTGTRYDRPDLFTGTGLNLNTSDNQVGNSVVQLCKVGIRNAKQANSFSQVHVWPGYVKSGSGAGTTMSTVNTAIYQTAAGIFSSYDQCYIDGGTVILEDPWETSITNGWFLHGGGDPDKSWIILKPLAAGRSIRGLVITGNKFKTTGGLLKALSVDSSLGSFSGSIKGCRFDNTFAPGVTRFDSRYTDRVSKTGASTWTWDLSPYFPVGVVQTLHVTPYQFGGATPAVFRVTNVTGNQITVGAFDPAAPTTPLAVNASVYLMADINIPIPEEAP